MTSPYDLAEPQAEPAAETAPMGSSAITTTDEQSGANSPSNSSRCSGRDAKNAGQVDQQTNEHNQQTSKSLSAQAETGGSLSVPAGENFPALPDKTSQVTEPEAEENVEHPLGNKTDVQPAGSQSSDGEQNGPRKSSSEYLQENSTVHTTAESENVTKSSTEDLTEVKKLDLETAGYDGMAASHMVTRSISKQIDSARKETQPKKNEDLSVVGPKSSKRVTIDHQGMH